MVYWFFSSGNIQRGHQSIKRQNGYEEDYQEITAEIQLTLANLDANLEGNLLIEVIDG